MKLLISKRNAFWRLALPALIASAAVVPTAFGADEEAPIAVKIHDHQFIPSEINVSAGEKHRLEIENQDATAEEFESHSLHREKIIAGNSKAIVFIGPLKPGRYEFYGEFNEATAHGAVVVK